MNNHNEDTITYFGRTSFRNKKKKFGIKRDDRRRHFYVIGKTGMGKTALLQNMMVQDIRNGEGFGFVDPHGEAAEELLDFIPPERINDVVYFNPADVSHAIGFNVLEHVEEDKRHLVASGLMGIFKKIWPDVWSARMEYILNNTVLALLEYPNSTMLGINRMMADKNYRKDVIRKVSDPMVKSFWKNEFGRYSEQFAVEATAAIQNKVGQFLSAPLIRNIVGQVKSTIDMREIMDEGKILILNLSKGKIGEDNAKLLGGLLVTKLQLAAMSRVDMPEEERKDFFLYIDEFQNFASKSFVTILSEARKYRLALILAHQYISQLEEDEKVGHSMRNAVFGNVGTIVSFRVGAEDAEALEKEFTPDIYPEDFINLPKYNVYVKLMIDGVSGKPFSAETLPPPEPPVDSEKDKIIRVSKERYAIPREKIEDKLNRWLGDFEETAGTKVDLYDAKCSNCGKKTKVPFIPDGSRPTYCRSCRKKMEEIEKNKKEKEEKKKKEKKENRKQGKSLKEALQEEKNEGDENKEDQSDLKKALRQALNKKD
ncbi:MAG: CxxC-x17-CxxC domain-containing protein [Patescibacteria group bacterium]